MTEKTDIFPVFNPIDERLLCYKSRRLVHTNGDWHKAVQANIVRPNRYSRFDILLQLRSDKVDIGPWRYDQSLATQMLDRDKLDETASLRRGLCDELAITAYRASRLPVSLRIIKRYVEQPEYFNREIISLFTVVLNNQTPRINTLKIDGLEWIDWLFFQQLLSRELRNFTKTAQFYFGDPILAPLVEEATFAAIRGTHVSNKAATGQVFLRIDCPPDNGYTVRGDLSTLFNKQGEVI